MTEVNGFLSILVIGLSCFVLFLLLKLDAAKTLAKGYEDALRRMTTRKIELELKLGRIKNVTEEP